MRCRPLQSLLPQGAAPEPAQLVQNAGRCPGQVVVQLRTGAAVLSLQGGSVALAKYAPGEGRGGQHVHTLPRLASGSARSA